MIKIFNALQIKKIDACTAENQSISSVDLMERASLVLFEALKVILDKDKPLVVVAGPGNNGGDALALARMLLHTDFELSVYLIDTNNSLSNDCKVNKDRLERLMPVIYVREVADIPEFSDNGIIIDGLFGSGLNRRLEGVFAGVVTAMNNSCSTIYSIDMPSGLFIEDNKNNRGSIVKADQVFTFQFPKLALLLPENDEYCQKMTVLDIHLCKESIGDESTDYYYTESSDISAIIKPLRRFAHKGTQGRAIIYAGSYGKMGAAVLAAKACLRAGVGLLTMHIPRCGIDIMQTAVPEAMVEPDTGKEYIIEAGNEASGCVIGVGPGIGAKEIGYKFLHELFDSYGKTSMVIDADAINLIASDARLKRMIPPESILTPHPLEFDRLVGEKSVCGFDRLQKAREFAQLRNVIIVLKGANSAIVTPKGKVYFNPTGNPGMATGGSGDVLTGAITSLLAQKYTPLEAALTGVYIHGLAADIAVESQSMRSLLPSDIISKFGQTYMLLGR